MLAYELLSRDDGGFILIVVCAVMLVILGIVYFINKKICKEG